MNWKQPKVYAVKHKDEATRAASRSGGIFTALSDRVLSDGGVVYGCILTDDFSSILSILFDRYLYLGGAHGTPLRKSMVVNLNTGEPIKLHEILPVSFSELMDILRNQLYVRYGSEDTEVLEVCYKNIVDLYHEVDEFKFYIRYSALYIYFDVYEISSYSMGYVDLYIMDLQEFLSERCDISECDIVRKQAIFEKIFKPNIR